LFFKQITTTFRFAWVLLAATPIFAQVRINTNSVLPGATLNQTYNFALTGAAGTSPYTFELASGTLPANINLNSSGVLSGPPTASGDFTFTVRITDSSFNQATKQFTLNVTAQPLTAQPFPPPANVPVGRLTGASVQGVGGTAPYKYSIISGTLPPGVNFVKTSCYCEAYAFIEGVPRTTGVYNVVVEVKDSNGRTATSPLQFNVVANPLNAPPTTLPNATRGAEYVFQLPYSGGFAPVTFNLPPSSSLPLGLQLTAGGKVRGIVNTSVAPGTYTFSAVVSDGAGSSVTVAYSINVVAAPLNTIVTNSTLPTGVANIDYGKQLIAETAVGVTGTWSVIGGSLPTGINLGATGQLAGITSQTGTFTFTAEFRINPTTATNKTFTLTISPTQFQWTFSSSLPSINRGQYSLSLGSFPTGMSGGTPASNVELISGAWPAGMDVTGNQYIAGTPTTATFYGFTVARIFLMPSWGSTTTSRTSAISMDNTTMAAATVTPGLSRAELCRLDSRYIPMESYRDGPT
jgi:hypothetical protein